MKRFCTTFMIVIAILTVFSCAGDRPPVILEPEQEWLVAEVEFKKKKYAKAVELYKTFLNHHRGHANASEAAFKIGECYYKQEDYVLAISRFEYFLKTFPFSKLADEAQYKIGLSHWEQKHAQDYDQTDIEKALQAFEQLVNTYPSSRWKADSILKISYCREILARKLYKAGMFYQRYDKYDSAIKYFDNLIDNYKDTNIGWVNWARYRKGQCLYFLGNKNKGDEQLKLAYSISNDAKLKREIMGFIKEME
ncbi:MAG: outer membrane protein assembly factor BamD [Candidatus Coatesbacteria bacterium]|nr:outer membrane protein assembly factor BamD [Candidatus Coatesbacteria bacterium]